MVMYRKDLTDAAGVTIADNDSWENVMAGCRCNARPGKNGVYGACLRGKPGWATAWRSSRQWQPLAQLGLMLTCVQYST
jgi:hypothetical protein